MRKTTAFLLGMTCVLGIVRGAPGMEYITGNKYGSSLDIVSDTYFVSGVKIDVVDINVHKSVLIQNDTIIPSNIHLCKNCNVVLRNSGQITGRVHIGADAGLVQVVQSHLDMTSLDVELGVGATYSVLVDGAQNLMWHDLYVMGQRAGKLVLRDTAVVMAMDAQRPFVISDAPCIELYGTITLSLPDDFIEDGAPLINNVYGDADVVIKGGNPGLLYAYSGQVRDDNLYLNRVRETDYYKILGSEQGMLLNKIRAVMPNDELLKQLDAAQDLSEIEDILSHSIAFHPIRLMRPVRILDAVLAGGLRMDIRGNRVGGIPTFRPFYLKGSDWDVYGASADMLLRSTKDFALGVSLYAALADSDDYGNRFSSQIVGGRGTGVYDNGVSVARMTVGFTRAYFEAPYIFDGGRMRDKARGYAVYSIADVGRRLGIFIPYVGAEYHYSEILNSSDTDINGRVGLDADIVVNGKFFRYNYKCSAGVNTARAAQFGAGAGVISQDENIGTDVVANIIRDGGETGWMISTSVKVRF